MKIAYTLRVASYGVSPAKSKVGHWSPWTVRRPFLAAFLALCVLLIVIVELLIRSCSEYGCPTFGPSSSTSLSYTTNFLYNYLPTILTVLFGLLWSTANHDFLRLEPFYRLSAPTGATAQDSLLLGYLYMFPLLVPFKAFRRRHWPVFFSSLILLANVLLLTPVTSALFDDADLRRPYDFPTTRSGLRSPSSANETFSAGFVYLSYDYAWLNGALPPFTTPEFALSPFLTPSSNPSNETWRAETTLYESGVSCTPATITPVIVPPFGTIGYNISDSRGTFHAYLRDLPKYFSAGNNGTDLITAAVPDFFIDPRSMRDQEVDFTNVWTSLTQSVIIDTPLDAWSNYTGPKYHLHIFGGIAEDTSLPPTTALPAWGNWTAVYCAERYYRQSATANVSMPSGEVVEVVRHGEREEYTPGTPGNGSFYTMLNDGRITAPPGMEGWRGIVSGFGYVPFQMPHMDGEMVRRFGGRRRGQIKGREDEGMSNVFVRNARSLSAFAMYGQRNETLGGLRDAGVLARVYEDAAKLLFAVAVSAEMVGGEEEVVEVVRVAPTKGFRVSALWARMTQGVLGLLGALTGGLMVVAWGRRCALDGEPNSLAAALGVLGRSEEACRMLEGVEFVDPKKAAGVLRASQSRWRMEYEEGVGPKLVEISGMDWEGLGVGEVLAVGEKRTPWKEQPAWPLNSVTGAVYLLFFVTLLAFLGAAWGYDKVHKGIPTIAPTNSFGYKVLFSYLPTLIGMLIEPMLVSIGAHQAMLGPYRRLARAATSPAALTLDYDQSPPHFQLFRALRARDIVLAALTTSILLANVLAVSLAGLFSASTGDSILTFETTPFADPSVVGGFRLPAQEMYYTLLGNISGGMRLPSWTTNEWYVLPFSLPDEPSLSRVESSTVAFGMDVQCDLLPREKMNMTCYHLDDEGTDCRYPMPSGDVYRLEMIDEPCWVWKGFDWWLPMNVTSFQWNDPGTDFFVRSRVCEDTFYVGWIERPGDPKPAYPEYPFAQWIDTAWLRCTAEAKAAEVTAVVDAGENVVAVRDVKVLEAGKAPNGTETLAPSFLDSIREGVVLEVSTNHLQWFNALMATAGPEIVRHRRGGNVTHIPDTANLTEVFEDVFRRVFAVSLSQYGEEIIAPGATDVVVTAIATVVVDRVAVSGTMGAIAVGIMVFGVFVLVALYWGGRAEWSGVLPTSMIAMYTYLYASNAREECAGVRGRTVAERSKRIVRQRGRYTWGGFITGEGRSHWGVYREKDEEETRLMG